MKTHSPNDLLDKYCRDLSRKLIEQTVQAFYDQKGVIRENDG